MEAAANGRRQTNATVAGDNYSPAMKSTDVTWTEDTLTKYRPRPKAFAPGERWGASRAVCHRCG